MAIASMTARRGRDVAWRIRRGEQIVGELVVEGHDHPWVLARLEPNEGFSGLRHLFEDDLRLLETIDEDFQSWHQIQEQIRSELDLVKEDGDAVHEFVLHIDGRGPWWRWSEKPLLYTDEARFMRKHRESPPAASCIHDWPSVEDHPELVGAELVLHEYDFQEHEHCRLCWAEIVRPGDFHAHPGDRDPFTSAYRMEWYFVDVVTEWICPTCAVRHRDRFSWDLVPEAPAE
jgi:hypothetical protein